MLSPGDWHKSVPKDLEGNLRFREAILKRAIGDLSFQQGIIDICRDDFLFFVNVFVWQFNPDAPFGKEVGPFISWSFQERAAMDRPETTGRKGILWCIENRTGAVAQKSRELGASWWFLIIQAWLCLFRENVQTLNISKSADAVDCKSPDSLFWKLRHIHKLLPDWLKGGDVLEQSMYIEYKNGSVITGVASTKDAGVSGRAKIIFIDEITLIPEAEQVINNTAGTSSTRFFNGTHRGIGTSFYELTKDDHFVQFQFHWTQHPEKNKGLYKYNPKTGGVDHFVYNEETCEIEKADGPMFPWPKGFEPDKTGLPTGGPFPGIRSPWYDGKVRDVKSEMAVAKELDINPKGSISQFYDPIKIRMHIQRCAQTPWMICSIKLDQNGRFIEFVEDPLGPCKLWFNLRDGKPPIGKYGAGADVSQGTGATPSCLSIFAGATGRKMIEYVNSRIDPINFAILTVAVCSVFQDEDGIGAKIGWEHVGPGVGYGKQIWDALQYTNILDQADETTWGRSPPRAPGWDPSKRGNKLRLHLDYRQALNNFECENPSATSLDETLAFKHTDDGSVEHAVYRRRGANASGNRDNHGDIVTADAIAWKIVKAMKQAATQAILEAAQWNNPCTNEGRFQEWLEENKDEENVFEDPYFER